jgi:hypothetical protein
LQNSVHYLLPYRKKDQFKAYGVKRDIPRMEMVHHQDVAVELSTRLLTAQHEIETLRTQLRKADTTIRGYMRMVEGQASDLYESDTETWTATSSVQSSSKEPAVSSHWLSKYDVVIQCARKAVKLTKKDGTSVEFVAMVQSGSDSKLNQTKAIALEDIRVVQDFPNVFLEELPGMPPDRDVEFLIELLPGTPPISRRTYRMPVNELVEL